MLEAWSRTRDGTRKLSANFTVAEFACKDGSDPVFVDSSLAALLQKIRDHFGRPVVITSGYRTAAHNKSVGGAAYSQHLYGQDTGIQGSVDPYGSNRNSRRHLYDSQQGIHTVERRADRHTDDRNSRHGSNDTTQVSSHTGSRDDDTDTSVFGSLGEFFYFFRCTVGRQCMHLERDFHLIEKLGCLFHNGQIRSTATARAPARRPESG